VFKFFGKRNTAAIAALVVAAVAGVGAYAFTASNTVPPEHAGAGTATVSGYTASNISYTFSPDTTKIDGVSFDLDNPANDVKVAIDTHGATPVAADYQDCSGATGTGPSYPVTCTFGTPYDNTQGTQDLYIDAVTSGSVTVG